MDGALVAMANRLGIIIGVIKTSLQKGKSWRYSLLATQIAAGLIVAVTAIYKSIFFGKGASKSLIYKTPLQCFLFSQTIYPTYST